MSKRIKRLHIAHCKLVITQQRSYCRSFCFCVLKSHLTPLFISSYDFAANVIYESTQGLCVVITILFSSLTFAASSKKAKFFICDSENRFCAGSSITFRKNEFVYLFATVVISARVSFETLFEIPDAMNLSNSDCAARYDVTNVDRTIGYNPLEAHTRGTALPDFSSKIKVSPLDLFTRAL